jgi:DNA repair protein RecO (recombination protein O)
LLTREGGKVSALAKGVRKISSKRSGNLDSLNHVIVNLAESGSGHKVITEVKTIESFIELKNSLERSQIGYYFAELVNKALEEDAESSGVFDLLNEYLGNLCKEEVKLNLLVSKFEYLLLKELGYGIGLAKLKSIDKNDRLSQLHEQVKEILGEDFKSLEL